MNDILSASGAARLLGCSEALIRKRIRSGDLPATKVEGKWRIRCADVERQPRPHEDTAPSNPTVEPGRTFEPNDAAPSNRAFEPGRTFEPNDAAPSNRAFEPPVSAWRDDLLSQVARLEADKLDAAERESEQRRDTEERRMASALREEASKARIIDLERAATVRESHIADQAAQIGSLEAKVREVLEDGKSEAVQLANRIADLVERQQESTSRIYELEPVAEQVPMLQAALDSMHDDIEAIASRPVTGPVFRLLTKGRLRR